MSNVLFTRKRFIIFFFLHSICLLFTVVRNFVWEKNHRQINHATFYCATAWNVQPRKSQKLRQKDSQQIVESFSHRALFLWTACVCSTEIENENRFCLVNVHQIWNQLLCNQVSQMFLLMMTPSSSLQLIFCVWEPNGSRFRISLILKDFFM